MSKPRRSRDRRKSFPENAPIPKVARADAARMMKGIFNNPLGEAVVERTETYKKFARRRNKSYVVRQRVFDGRRFGTLETIVRPSGKTTHRIVKIDSK